MAFTETEARAALQTLLRDFHAIPAHERREMSEASVVRQFIDRLFGEVLGWPIKDPARYKYELSTQAGRPDLTLIPESGGVIFIEAKRIGLIQDLQKAKSLDHTITPAQMALPGMAVDRTPQEQQAINYAFENGGTWAILTNFERLRLFNARRDWLVLSFESPKAYEKDFDWLWQLAYPNLINGSLDALSNQRYSEEVDTEYLKFINDWRQKLAQDVVNRPAHNPWAFSADGRIDLPKLRAVVQRFLDRLVIIRFAEDQLVITSGTLRKLYEAGYGNRYFDLDDSLDKLFARFNQTHNSALFAPGLADQASFSDGILLELIDKLYGARYRSMLADIMGNTYEQYLGKTLVQRNGAVATADNLETRKKQGSYYTPQVIVRYIVDHSLGRYLYGTANGKRDGEPLPGETRKTSADIRDLRVLDGACGSGSFLIYAYQVLADFYEGEIARLEQAIEQRRQQLIADGKTDPFTLGIELTPLTAERQRLIDNYPRLIVESHLYGVDLDPQAAEIAVVNLIMRVMEGRHRDKVLPLILNQNIKVGNSLVGLRPNDPRLAEHASALANVRRLRATLLKPPHGPDHDRIITELEAASADLNTRLNAYLAPHFTDVTAARPFHWTAEFPEVFVDADGTPLDNPGFTIVIGNPPWEIVKPDLREFYAQFDARIESRLNRAEVEQRIAELDAADPRRRETFAANTRAIEETTAYTRACGDYTRQGRGDPATHKLFLERLYGILQREGRLGYVVPSGIYTDLGTKPLREMLLNEGNIQYIYSFSNERFFFSGVDHRFKFALLGAQKGQTGDGFWAAFRFNPRVAVRPDDLPAFLANPDNLIYVRRESLAKFSPDSLSVMEFQTRRDYEVAEKLYGDWPLLGEEPHPPAPSPLAEAHNLTPNPSPRAERGASSQDSPVLFGKAEFQSEFLSAGGEELVGPNTPIFGESLTTSDSPSPSTERELGGEVSPSIGGAIGERWFSPAELWDKLKPLARQMRTKPTPAEDHLWQRLRNRQIHNLKFRRQHSIDRFMVDFYCADARLIVEVDGPIHDYTPEEDAIRQAFLESQGFHVLRFTNDAVLNHLPSVIARIAEVAEAQHLTPNPSPLTERGVSSRDSLASRIDHAASLSNTSEVLPTAPHDSPSPPAERGLGGEVPLWSVRFNRQFDMANDRRLLNPHGKGIPLYEGKMIHQYNAFYEDPQFWINEENLIKLPESVRQEIKTYRVVHRRIARSTDERTLISAIVPRQTACDTNATMVLIDGNADDKIKLFLCALLNSFVLDYLIRYKVSTTLNMFYMETLPLPRLNPGDPYFDAIVPRAARLTCTRPEFADLWQAVMGEAWPSPPAPLQEEGGVENTVRQVPRPEGEGFRVRVASGPATDPVVRQQLRDEIDALVARLYGLSRADFDHILGTFPLVFPDTAEGRAKRESLLATYDRLNVGR